jgi:hypothetical protein
MRIKTVLTIPALLALGASAAFAASTFIVESGPGGQNSANYTDSGFAASGTGVGLPGCTATGSRYSGTGTYFGPTRYAQYSFTPGTAGYYECDLAWISTAGETHTAVNLYTGANTGGPNDVWGNSGPVGVITSGTMNMYYTGVGAWNQFTVANMAAGTTYKLGLYGGYKTPYAGGATPADANANRVTAGAARFIAATPLAATYTGPANDASDIPVTGTSLSWTAGTYDSLYNVWFGTSAGSLTEIGTGLSATSLSLDPQGMQGGTEYFWRVDPVNVDVTATGSVFDFTTVPVPEPSTALLSLLGGLGMVSWVNRRRTA